MSKNPLHPVDARTLRQTVTEAIRQGILQGDLLPGMQVNQAQIAEQLGVSRGPVREALGQLEEEGLIKNVPYKGTYVTEITSDYITELYSIRQVIETFAARLAAERATAEDLAELRNVLEAMYATAAQTDMAQMSTLDIQFHYLICRSAHHSLLLQLWKSIAIGVRRCLALRHRIYQSPLEVIGTHPDILAALEARQAEQASTILGIHIADAGQSLLRSWAHLQAEAAEAQAEVDVDMQAAD
ncbi:MAG: GntR family transcriptional regulator [Oscillochloridaceae bacterium umkhey_bin13]